MSRPSRRAPRILVVDDDPGLLRLLTIRLRSQNYVVEPVDGPAKALAAVSRFRPDLVVTDLRMAEMDGIALLRELQRRWPSLNVIMLTAHGTIPDAVKATQSGAFAFLTKPVEKDQLLDEVRRALKTSGFADTGGDDWRAEFATRSPLMEDRLAKAHMVAGTDGAVLITGEHGTGKELLAKAIHRASERREEEFVALDCGRLDPATGEAEIAAAFERARAGTLQLRDIDDLPPSLRQSLARQLVGAKARVIATGDRPPEDLAGDATPRPHRPAGRGAAWNSRRSASGARTSRCSCSSAWTTSPRNPHSRSAAARPRRWNSSPPPAGRATCGNCGWWCARPPRRARAR